MGTTSTLPTTGGAGTSGGATPNGFTYNSYSVGVAITSFEVDFWGRVRNLTEAARAQYLASIAAERAFRISLIRDLATAYITARSQAEQIEQTEQTLAARVRSLQIAKLRLDAGVTSALDYRQTETLLTQAQTELASLRDQRAQQLETIRILWAHRSTAPGSRRRAGSQIRS